MQMPRKLVVGLLTAVAALSLGVAVSAAPYDGEAIDVSDSTPPVGGTITLTGSGFAPNSGVEFYFLSTPTLLGTYTANASGVVSASVALPADATGPHTIRLVGVAPNQSPLTLEKPITVGENPSTSSNSSEVIRWVVAFLVLGGLLTTYGFVRRRNASTSE